MRFLSAFLFSLAAGPAYAAMPPEAYEAMRAEATHHVQLRLIHEEPMKRDARAGLCEVAGEVVRIFRDTGGMTRPGAVFRFQIGCVDGNDGGKLVGPWVRFPVKDLTSAKHLEVFLSEEPCRVRVVDYGHGARLLERPTVKPAFK